MDNAQNRTKLTKKQEDYILYCAIGTYWPETKDEPMLIGSVTEYCKVAGIGRRTAYDWEAGIPNFWDLVEEQRRLLLNRKITEYYKWAELSARPVVRKKRGPGGGEVLVVRPGSAEHLKILLGQSGRRVADKSESKVDYSGEVSFTNQVPLQ